MEEGTADRKVDATEHPRRGSDARSHEQPTEDASKTGAEGAGGATGAADALQGRTREDDVRRRRGSNGAGAMEAEKDLTAAGEVDPAVGGQRAAAAEEEEAEPGASAASVAAAAPDPPASLDGPPKDRRSSPRPDETGLSKNALKRKRKLEHVLQRNKERKLDEKRQRRIKVEKRRKEREEQLASLDPSERERILAARLQRMSEFRAQEKKLVEETRRKILSSRQRVCIDLEWHTQQTEKEISSLLKQLNYTYSAVRKAVAAGREGLHLFFTGVNGQLLEDFQNKLNGYEQWPVEWSEKLLLDVFATERESLVYLTHESSSLLEQLDDSKVYIIGGIVDRNRIKGGTAQKAKELGVVTARLDLGTDKFAFTTGTTVLTVNHVAEILLEAANGIPWHDAIKRVLPVRKGVVGKKAQCRQEDGERDAQADAGGVSAGDDGTDRKETETHTGQP